MIQRSILAFILNASFQSLPFDLFLFLIELTSSYIIFLKVTGKAPEGENVFFNYKVLSVHQQVSGPTKPRHKKFKLNGHTRFNPLKLLS